MKNLFLLFTLIIALVSCSEDEKPSSKEANMRVNYYTEECTGEMTGQCLLVQEDEAIGGENWSYFYFAESIVGFHYEEGFIYDLIVEKNHISKPQQDASSIEYSLVEIVSKTAAP